MRAAYNQSLTKSSHPTAELAKYVGDPLKAQLAQYLVALTRSGIVFKGTPPTYQPVVDQVDPGTAQAQVVLRDCPQNGDEWHSVYISTGKPAEAPGQQSVPRPVRATLVRYQDQWLVTKLEGSRTATC
jgi:hypothetical protein